MIRFAPALAAGALAVMIWLSAPPDGGGVFGRLGYGPWLVFTSSVLLCAIGALIALLPERRRYRASLRAGATLCIGIAFPLAVVEAGVRLWPSSSSGDNPFYIGVGTGVKPGLRLPFERPPHLEWRGSSRGDLAQLAGDRDPFARMLTFRTDHEGFRNPQDLRSAELAFVGDSHTEAGNLPVAETFPHLVGRALGATHRNLGRAGYSPSFELIVLELYALPMRPRVVVWQLTETNDLVEEVRFRHWVRAGRPRVLEEESGKREVVKASPTRLLFERLRRSQPWHTEARLRDRDGTFYPVRFLSHPGPESDPNHHAGWPPLAKSLREGQKLLAAEGIALIVLHIPMKLRVLAPSIEPADWLRGRPEVVPPLEGPFAAALRLLCAELEVPFLDATPALAREAGAGPFIYQPFDTHLAARGHEIVAELLGPAVAEAL